MSPDAEHEAQARRTEEPGWVEAEPQVVFLPEPVRLAVQAWAVREQGGSAGPAGDSAGSRHPDRTAGPTVRSCRSVRVLRSAAGTSAGGPDLRGAATCGPSWSS